MVLIMVGLVPVAFTMCADTAPAGHIGFDV
jgi:hypothetical protein